MHKKLGYKVSAWQPTHPFQNLFDQPYLLLVLATLFWSGNFVLARAVRADVPPVALAFWRWCGGSILLFGFAWPYLKRDWGLALRRWKIMLLLSFLGVASFNTLVYTGLQFTTAINALLLQSTMPVLIVLMTYLFFRETVRPVQILGVVLSLAGVVTIGGEGNWQVLRSLSLNLGDMLIFIAVICYAAYSAWLRRRPPMHPLSFLAATFMAGTIMLLPFYLWESGAGRVMSLDRVTLLTIGYVAVFPSILAYFFYNRGVELAGANRAGLFMHLMPVFGSVMAVVFLSERFQCFHVLGIFLILVGILLATRPKASQ
jgi:drug/metabolite transporter (DMT)-like permease